MSLLFYAHIRTFQPKNLGQIKKVYPASYRLYQQKSFQPISKRGKDKNGGYELMVEADLNEFSKNSGAQLYERLSKMLFSMLNCLPYLLIQVALKICDFVKKKIKKKYSLIFVINIFLISSGQVFPFLPKMHKTRLIYQSVETCM